MLENRDYMREGPKGFWWPATATLLAVNVFIFLLQVTLLDAQFLNYYFALSLEGLYHGFVWQFLTFQFLHSTPWPWHLLFNGWALFVFGRDVEYSLGIRRFLILYFSSGMVGGLFQEFVALIWPHYFGSAVVGASAGIFGVVTAFAMLFPERVLTLLIFYIVPVNMKAKNLFYLSLLMAALGIATHPKSGLLLKLLGNNVAHAAHFGGSLAGLALIVEVFNLPKSSAPEQNDN